MKKLLTTLFITALFFYTPYRAFPGGIPADKHATPETMQLYKKMLAFTSRGIMIGHQDDLAYGIGWQYPNGQSDVYRVIADYPAIFGWDLGHLELGSAYNLDSVAFADMMTFAKTVHQQGGINQYSWHCNNPLTGGSTWDTSNKGTVKSILPGGEKHEVYTDWLDKIAEFLLNLRDEDGNAIPVLFRPFHELEGDWFWWGKPYCSSDEFKELFRFTIDYLIKTKGVHNILIVYSNADTFTDCHSFLDRYPGDDYIDIIGFDVYQSPKKSNADFSDMVKHKLSILNEAAVKTGKLPAITEMGYEQIPDPKWWTEVLWPTIRRTGISYILFWRNAANRPNHYYMPYPGQISEKDFLEFYHYPETLFSSDLK
jgi:mannan endo-1,4-beta-mannosidase